MSKIFKASTTITYDVIQLSPESFVDVAQILSENGYCPKIIKDANQTPIYIKLDNAAGAERIYINDYLTFDDVGIWSIVKEEEFKNSWRKS